MPISWAAIVGGISLTWQIGRSWMGRPAIIARRSPTCDLTFNERDMLRWRRQWSVTIEVRPPQGVRVRNCREYRFECLLIRSGLGVSQETVTFSGGWNSCTNEWHESPIRLTHEPIQVEWVSVKTGDWGVRVLATLRSGQRRVLYDGPPTGNPRVITE